MKRVAIRSATIALIVLAAVRFTVPAEGKGWTRLADGLLLGEFQPGPNSPGAEDPVVVLKVDVSRCSLRLLTALENGGKSRTTREWCEEFGLLAAINAGMYMSDLRSTGFMSNYGEANNPAVNPAYGAFMLFNPKDKALPAVRWMDSRGDKEWQNHLRQYHSAIQNFRMISNGKKVKWPKQDKAHSMAALGMDRSGHVLFIFSRAFYTPYDFIEILLSLPIQIRDAMYLEGGDEASLCVHREERWIEWSGINGIPFLPNTNAPPIPNVIGVTRHK